jgi:hypothetical protein
MGLVKAAALVYIGYYIGKKSLPAVVKQAESLIAANQDILSQLADQASLTAGAAMTQMNPASGDSQALHGIPRGLGAQSAIPSGLARVFASQKGMGRLRANYRRWVR